jgi:acetyl-CoA carboxylase biotin carboxyl carrier protein
MTQNDSDLTRMKELIDIMKDNELVEVQIEHGDDKILLKRSVPGPAVTAVPIIGPHISAMSGIAGAGQISPAGTQPGAILDEGLVEIKSPLVGTFYARPSPDSESYVDIGSQVNPQTVVCIIEAMKVMNEIKAEMSGTIVKIMVTSGQAVEYGQVLFKVKPE